MNSTTVRRLVPDTALVLPVVASVTTATWAPTATRNDVWVTATDMDYVGTARASAFQESIPAKRAVLPSVRAPISR